MTAQPNYEPLKRWCAERGITRDVDTKPLRDAVDQACKPLTDEIERLTKNLKFANSTCDGLVDERNRYKANLDAANAETEYMRQQGMR